jgi:PKHD-type hydroxylase
VYRFPSIRRGADGQVALAWDEGARAFHDTLELDTVDSAHKIRVARGAFTAEECRRIVEFGDAQQQFGALAERDERSRYRSGKVAWLPPDEGAHWLYHRLAVLFNEANQHYDFELLGLLHAPQYATYQPGHHFDWHIDVGSEAASLRKLSLSVQLSDSGAYGGGDLEFPFPDVGIEEQREIGAAIIFPSYLAHRVSPVTFGVRRSLVAWACGPTFR